MYMANDLFVVAFVFVVITFLSVVFVMCAVHWFWFKVRRAIKQSHDNSEK